MDRTAPKQRRAPHVTIDGAVTIRIIEADGTEVTSPDIAALFPMCVAQGWYSEEDPSASTPTSDSAAGHGRGTPGEADEPRTTTLGYIDFSDDTKITVNEVPVSVEDAADAFNRYLTRAVRAALERYGDADVPSTDTI